jgi:NAD(P)-dependent dehydrogenase (short-subunit alcohol dehydrogenase family)
MSGGDGRDAFLLAGRRVLVAGGAGTIAGAICRLFAAHGARVFVADVAADRVEALVAEITAAGGDAEGFVGDLTEAEQLEVLVRRLDHAGGTDILVNCLGHYLDAFEPFEENDEDLWQRLYEINLLPVMRACRLVLPGMRERQYGRIINFSSVEGIRASPYLTAYGAFKGAVDAFTRSLAVEAAGDNVLVNAVAVDKTRTIQTNFLQVPPEYEHLVRTWVPRGRYAEGADIANIALFLASDLADWMVGSTLLADGGTIAAGGWYRTPKRWTTQPLIHQYFEDPEANESRPPGLQ